MDGARLLACVAIVWLHTPETPALEPSTTLGRFAVPFFTQAAVFLAFLSGARLSGEGQRNARSPWDYAAGRFRRLYGTFLIWNVLYALSRGLSHRLLHQEPYRPGVAALLWDGCAHHLWFLPFIALATTGAFVLGWALGGGGKTAAVSILAVLAGLAFSVAPVPAWLGPAGYLAGLSYSALPSVCWGIALAAVWRRPTGDDPASADGVPGGFRTATGFGVGIALWVGGTAWAWTTHRRPFTAEHLAGTGLLLAALNPRGARWLAPLAPLGAAALGLYLIHIFWLEGFQHFAHRRLPLSSWSGPAFDAATFAFTLGSSAVSVLLLRANRWTRGWVL